MGNAVTLRVVIVVVGVVRFRVNFVERACDIEGVVDNKCDVVLL